MEFWIKILLVVAAASAGIGSKFIFKMKDDNAVEEMAEGVIKQETGYDVDLSPETPENK